jgi:hypothetical protein
MAPVMANASACIMQQLDDAVASQETKGGMKLIVKNTFFDVDEDAPDMLGLQRAVTGPACPQGRAAEADIESESDSDTAEEGPLHTSSAQNRDDTDLASEQPVMARQKQCRAMAEAAGHGTPEHFESCHGALLPAMPRGVDAQFSYDVAPTPPALTRLETFDAFEHWEPQLEAPLMSEHLFMGPQLGIGQWLPVGPQYLVAAQAQQSAPFPTAEAQTAYAPEFDAQPFNEQQSFIVPSNAIPQQTALTGDFEELALEEEWEPVCNCGNALLTDSLFCQICGVRQEQVASHSFQPQTLRQYWCRTTGVTRTEWVVDGRKLRSNDRLTVSPLFKLSDGHVNLPPLPFKMIISPKSESEGKGGASFRKSKGQAVIVLKCEAPREELESYPISFYLSAGSGRDEDPRILAQRGPVTRDFTQSGVCGLPKECESWDLLDVVDEQSQTFVVCLEVLPPQH